MKIFTVKLRNRILSLNIKYYFLIAFFLQLIPSLVLTSFNINNSNRTVQILEQSNSNLIVFLFVVIIGPVFETVIFQLLFINAIKAFSAKSRYTIILSVIIPSVLFGLSHPYSLYYILFSFLIGLIYSSVYYVSQFLRKENGFLIVLLLHSLNNLLAYLTN